MTVSVRKEVKENHSQAAKMQGLWGHLRNNSSCGSLFEDSRLYWGVPGGNGGKEPACLEKEMATHSSILAWKNPWTEESGGLKSMGLHD